MPSPAATSTTMTTTTTVETTVEMTTTTTMTVTTMRAMMTMITPAAMMTTTWTATTTTMMMMMPAAQWTWTLNHHFFRSRRVWASVSVQGPPGASNIFSHESINFFQSSPFFLTFFSTLFLNIFSNVLVIMVYFYTFHFSPPPVFPSVYLSLSIYSFLSSDSISSFFSFFFPFLFLSSNRLFHLAPWFKWLHPSILMSGSKTKCKYKQFEFSMQVLWSETPLYNCRHVAYLKLAITIAIEIALRYIIIATFITMALLPNALLKSSTIIMRKAIGKALGGILRVMNLRPSCTVGQNQVVFRHQILQFCTSPGVSVWAS